MEFFLLGTGTLVPEAHRSPSGYLLKGPEGLALVDGGSGTLGRISGIGHDFRELEACLYTHRHPDHTADLIPLLFARKYSPGPAIPRLRIWGPSGFPAFVGGLQQAWNGWATPERPEDLELLEVPPSEEGFEVAGLEVRGFPVEHSDPGLAYRFRDPESGSTLCYSGDTEPCPGLLDAASDVDVLVVECSFPDAGRVAGHMTPADVGEVVRACAPRRVILTHLYPVTPPESLRVECERAAGRPVELGRDGMSVLLG